MAATVVSNQYGYITFLYLITPSKNCRIIKNMECILLVPRDNDNMSMPAVEIELTPILLEIMPILLELHDDQDDQEIKTTTSALSEESPLEL